MTPTDRYKRNDPLSITPPAGTWTCPVPGHTDVERDDDDDDEARCLAPGCLRSSSDPPGGRRSCECELYDCDGSCCGPGQCSCSTGASTTTPPGRRPSMAEYRWSPADRELMVSLLWTWVCQGGNAGPAWERQPAADAPMHLWADAAALLDALTAAGWRPPPPEPDGIHWRTGGSVGCTIYDPYGDLAGMLLTPEAAAAVVAVLNASVGEVRDAR